MLRFDWKRNPTSVAKPVKPRSKSIVSATITVACPLSWDRSLIGDSKDTIGIADTPAVECVLHIPASPIPNDIEKTQSDSPNKGPFPERLKASQVLALQTLQIPVLSNIAPRNLH